MGIVAEPIYWVVCDHDRCSEHHPDEEHFPTGWSAGSVEKHAEKSGWKERGGFWYCPQHAKWLQEGGLE
jgi:hypothetical protein